MSGGARLRERVVPSVGLGWPSSVRMRTPSGRDELALGGVDTRAAAQFLDRLVEPGLETGKMAASDRDRLLAALHRGLWGDRIMSSLPCAACGALFDLSFELSGLERALDAARVPAIPVGERAIEAEGVRYVLPDADAEEAAALGGAEGRAALLRSISEETDGLEGQLEGLAPILDVDLEAVCAECGHQAAVRFDIQTFTLQRLLDEREALLAQVHAIAAGYGWSLEEILGLERSLRQRLAERLREAV